jgi:PPK2 family polyphosphate:nucleotide phosphotransferase
MSPANAAGLAFFPAGALLKCRYPAEWGLKHSLAVPRKGGCQVKFEKELVVSPGKPFKLSKRDPDNTMGLKSKKDSRKRLGTNLEKITELQRVLWAEGKHAVLIVLQAMDAGGKDGTIRKVMSGVNPQGCRVTSFKAPTPEERSHDFLWRIHKAVPRLGEIGIFNRSHYEDVLVVRVHNLVDNSVWKKRYDQINAFEKGLADNGVTILKFFLHISKDEQKRRFLSRIEEPDKNWKLSQADFDERKFWDEYMKAFEEALARCSTPRAPWYAIPANAKWFRDLAISEILLAALKRLDMKYPPPQVDPSTLVLD